MLEFKTIEEAPYALALIVPGLIIVFFRTRFTSGKTPAASEAIVPYFALTAGYYAVLFPFIKLALSIPGDEWTWWFGWTALTLAIPALLGAALGILAQRGVLHNFLR